MAKTSVKRVSPVARQTPEVRNAGLAGKAMTGSLPTGVNFGKLVSEAMGIARRFCSFLNPENDQPAISNWPTQLLGNRILSGEIRYSIGGKKSTHAISGFMPARSLKTGKPEKGAVRVFRLAYEAGSLPANATGKEFLNLLTYCTLSSVTGELPSPNRASGESTIKGSIALSFLTAAQMTLDSVLVVNAETGQSIEIDGMAAHGILSAFDQNRMRIEKTWTPRQNVKAAQAGNLDWESL